MEADIGAEESNKEYSAWLSPWLNGALSRLLRRYHAAKHAPDATVKKAQKQEIKHTMQYVALDKPKVYYTVTVLQDGKEKALGVKPDGTLVKRATFRKK